MKHLLVMLLLLCSVSVSAQDVIVKKDGSTILSKVLEVEQDVIKYKKYSNPNGPTYTINKGDVQTINYENGDIDKFVNIKASSISKENSSVHNQIESEEDININRRIIETWNNRTFTYTGDIKKKIAKYQYRILNIHKDSKIANKNALIAVSHSTTYYEKFSGKKVLTTKMLLVFSNNSDDIIYIDLANCFFRSGQSAESYFINSSTEVTKGKNVGTGVNVGAVTGALGIGGAMGQIANGINVSGGKSSSTTVTTYNDRYIAVAPHTVYSFPSATFYESNDLILPYMSSYITHVNVGGMEEFEEPKSINETPWSIIVSYSFDQNFASSNQFKMGLYVSKQIGLPGIGWNGSLINTDRYFLYSNGQPDFYIFKAK